MQALVACQWDLERVRLFCSFLGDGECWSTRSLPMGNTMESTRLLLGENLAELNALSLDPCVRGQVMLAYLDPPYWTGRQHRMLGTRQETERGAVAFDDRWPTLADYLTHIRERVTAIRSLLASAGSLVVHVDPKTSHYIKVLIDEVFGMDSFQSEVIWRYRRWPSKTKNFQRVHDVMLRYVKDPQAPSRFVQLYEELAPSTKKTWGTGKQRAITNDSGKRVRSSALPEASPGVPLGDVWEIGIIAPVAKERTGYPTQKPLALMERWIAACTHPGDLVLDPYMGSGTTVVAAEKLGRRAIGIEQNPEAHWIAAKRLRMLEEATMCQK